ncbi:tripartite motif-containing protein 16-like [Paramisgurnus dabryanus]|uniref:tripartite motif-containing protein 16-like n=1 Tax=Paramisgurnus dabryanus TaxID=90735 RepID=UPI0031F34F85
MAESSISWAQDQFICPVCLDLLNCPVAIPCGHSYCMSCITKCWNQKDQKRDYSCPQCRQTFKPRPALSKNTILAGMVEKLKKTEVQADVSAQCSAGDVPCDVCTEIKHKAVKSCLMCLNSYCQHHLQQHEIFFKGKRHNLIDVTGRLQEIICPQHDRLMEIFCRTDQRYVCYLCMMDEHKNHDTVSAAAERTEKQMILVDTKKKYNQRMIQIEKELKDVKDVIKSHKRSAQTAVKDSERIFSQLICSIERRRSEVIQLIRDQEKAAVSRAEERLELLKQEIDDLRRRDTELEKLSHTDDHIHFLQSFQSLSVSLECKDEPNITFTSQLSFDDVRKSVSILEEKLQDFYKEIDKIYDRVTCIKITPNDEPKTRQEFIEYFCQLSLDTNTMNKNLHPSWSNRRISWTDRVQQYPDHPDRFDDVCQVLCRERLCGRCYWEIEWSTSIVSSVCISVSYKSISRKGLHDECGFGCNDQSWSLFCSSSRWSFYHNNKRTDLPVVSRSCIIGVYVDHSAGSLSFYRVSDTMKLIHRVQTTFTKPLYPGFWLRPQSTVKLCDL